MTMALQLCYNDAMIRFSLRLPDEIYRAIKELAEKEKRSVNSQIIYILTEYLKKVMQQG